jgi:hypothetical protein
MSNLMSERKARRLAARVARDAAFITRVRQISLEEAASVFAEQAAFLTRVRQVSREIENAILDRRALLARHLEEAESVFKEQRHGPRTCSNYVDPHSPQAARRAD